MRRWVMVGMVAVVGVLVVGLIVSAVQRARLTADREKCLYHFKHLGQFAQQYGDAVKPLKLNERPADSILQLIPPGTVPNLALPPDERLSWIAASLPLLDHKTQATGPLKERIDLTLPWNAGPNAEVAKNRLAVVLCPGAVPETPDGTPAPTQFIGVAGLGTDAATLLPTSPRAGCFRYDDTTSLQLVRAGDGLATTFLFAETAADLGPWIRGGFSTVRGLDVADGAKPPLGPGGQFGGNYPNAAGFGFADGSARFFPLSVGPAVLRAHFTMAANDGGGVSE